MIGFELSKGTQTGTLNLNDNEVEFKVYYNSDFKKYYINIYKEDILLIGGRYLVNGCDLLYNMKHLNLGKSLIFIGEKDLSEAFLIYEES